MCISGFEKASVALGHEQIKVWEPLNNFWYRYLVYFIAVIKHQDEGNLKEFNLGFWFQRARIRNVGDSR